MKSKAKIYFRKLKNMRLRTKYLKKSLKNLISMAELNKENQNENTHSFLLQKYLQLKKIRKRLNNIKKRSEKWKFIK